MQTRLWNIFQYVTFLNIELFMYISLNLSLSICKIPFRQSLPTDVVGRF